MWSSGRVVLGGARVMGGGRRIDLALARRLAREGVRAAEIARQCGVTPTAIYRAVRLGEIVLAEPASSEGDRVELDGPLLRELVRQGLSMTEIGRRTGYGKSVVIRACERFGVGRPAGRRTRTAGAVVEAAPQVSASQDRRASLIATGGRYAALADWAVRFGVSGRQAMVEWHRVRGSAGVKA